MLHIIFRVYQRCTDLLMPQKRLDIFQRHVGSHGLCRGCWRKICGVTFLCTVFDALPDRILRIFSIPHLCIWLCGRRSETNTHSLLSSLLAKYSFRATSAFAFRKLILCLLPFPNRCTVFSCQSMSVFLSPVSSETLQPVEYITSIIANSFGVLQDFRRYSNSICVNGTRCFFSYLIFLIGRAGFFSRYPSRQAHS